MSSIKKSFFKEVKVEDVMEELKAADYFEKTHREMVASFKDTLAYKQIREVAIKHMYSPLTNPSPITRDEKRNQITRIGFLAFQTSLALSKTLSDRLSQEPTVTVKNTLKRMSNKNSENSESVHTRGRKRKSNAASLEISQNTNEANKRPKHKDDESEVSLGGISEKSVSSVHTSDLSSFDDEIVVSSEDEKGEKKEKKISFKTANKAYLDDKFSKICNVIFSKDTGEASKESMTDKKFLPGTSQNSSESKDTAVRPKRERKPNSKYSA